MPIRDLIGMLSLVLSGREFALRAVEAATAGCSGCEIAFWSLFAALSLTLAIHRLADG